MGIESSFNDLSLENLPA